MKYIGLTHRRSKKLKRNTNKRRSKKLKRNTKKQNSKKYTKKRRRMFGGMEGRGPAPTISKQKEGNKRRDVRHNAAKKNAVPVIRKFIAANVAHHELYYIFIDPETSEIILIKKDILNINEVAFAHGKKRFRLQNSSEINVPLLKAASAAALKKWNEGLTINKIENEEEFDSSGLTIYDKSRGHLDLLADAAAAAAAGAAEPELAAAAGAAEPELAADDDDDEDGRI